MTAPIASPTLVPLALRPDVDSQTAAALERVHTADEARHRHDMMNTLTAVEGAATILAGDRLSMEDRTTLGRVLASGVRRLRSLILGDDQALAAISLSQVAGDVAREPQWYGGVDVDVARDLVAMGSAMHVAEAVRQLLACGRELAPGAALVLRGRQDGEFVGLWLQAGDGPPTPLQLPVPAYVAARLVRGRGGDIRTEVGAAGGPSIGICLPASPDRRDEPE